MIRVVLLVIGAALLCGCEATRQTKIEYASYGELCTAIGEC